MNKNTKDILTFLGVGLVAGFLASFIMGGGSLVYYLLIGVLGSIVGGFIFGKLGIAIRVGSDLVNRILTSAVGAIIVVLIARAIA